MKKQIEGFRVDISAGHYETSDDGEHTYLCPDYLETLELTFTNDFVPKGLAREIQRGVKVLVDKIISEEKKRKRL